MAAGPESQRERMPETLRARAEAFAERADNDADGLAAEALAMEREAAAMGPAVVAAKATFDAAARRETTRIALGLQPRHEAAAKKVIRAVERLSAATSEERAVRRELERTAPVATSPFLPDLTTVLGCGTIAEYGSPAWQFARMVRQLRILE